MGKTKIKTIDDSQPVEEKPKKKAAKPKDELVEKLKAELGMDQNNSEKPSKPEGQISGESDISETTGKQSLSEFSEKTKVQKIEKAGKSKPRSKKYLEASKDLDRSKAYPLPQAVELVKKVSYAKFNGTLEAHINTLQAGIRGLVALPFASGKSLRILVFGPSTSLRTIETEGIVFGDDSTIEQISKGKVDFDLVITTPEWMAKLAKVAKILGPRGLMPNPKNGTITDDLKKAVASFQAGKTEYKTESKAPVIHLPMGKLNQPDEELISNIKTLYQTIGKTRIKKLSLSPTMGAPVKVDLGSI